MKPRWVDLLRISPESVALNARGYWAMLGAQDMHWDALSCKIWARWHFYPSRKPCRNFTFAFWSIMNSLMCLSRLVVRLKVGLSYHYPTCFFGNDILHIFPEIKKIINPASRPVKANMLLWQWCHDPLQILLNAGKCEKTAASTHYREHTPQHSSQSTEQSLWDFKSPIHIWKSRLNTWGK